MPSADLSHPAGNAFEYTGFIYDANGRALTETLTGLAASGVFDGGAPTSTGIAISAGDQPGKFDLTITAAAMEIEDQVVITITAANAGAQTLELTVRTGQGRQWNYGAPESQADADAGGICEETGLHCPASKMKRLGGKRVADFVDFVSDP